MKRLQKILILFFGIILVASSTTAIESKIAKDCGDNYQPIISMEAPENKTNNPGVPGMYKYNVCVSGISDSSVSESCPEKTGFYLSSKDRDAHISEQNSYYWNVCTGQMTVRITDGPQRENETALFSVSDKHNGHVAKPGVFDYTAYGQTSLPENVTLTMKFNLSSTDRAYFDDQKVEGSQTFTPPATLPYLVSESGSYTSGIVSSSFLRAERRINSENILSMTKEGSSEFILPLTEGSHSDIEEKEQQILNSEFQDSTSPNFGFQQIDIPDVHVRLQRSEIISNISLGSGTHRLNITKVGENQVRIEEVS